MISVYDLDGVLSRSDTMAALVFARLRRRPWLAGSVALLALAAALAGPGGRLRPRCNRAIVHLALAGVTEEEYLQLADAVARRLAARDGNAPEEVLAALRRSASEGVVVVSTATERWLAHRYLAEIGVTEVQVHASQLRFLADGARFAAHNVGENKAAAFRAAFPGEKIAVLHTDSASDLPLARMSVETVLVRPSRRTLRAFARAGVAFRIVDA
ncbi:MULTISPECIES: HAD family hydrolase [unclassified Microbacterium]|uniref:HAD family hydrolase n=1 Tax=unclassified Microbacterium TaxID=2609290 RepID=UPI00343FE578